MNDTEDALSKRALASMEVPLGAVTRTQQVMSEELNCKWTAAFEAICTSVSP